MVSDVIEVESDGIEVVSDVIEVVSDVIIEWKVTSWRCVTS